MFQRSGRLFLLAVRRSRGASALLLEQIEQTNKLGPGGEENLMVVFGPPIARLLDKH